MNENVYFCIEHRYRQNVYDKMSAVPN